MSETPTEVYDVLAETLNPDQVGPDQAYVVKAVETIHTEYNVVADNPAQAADRLRRYFADPGMVALGVVQKQGDGERVRWRIPSEKTDAKK